MSRPAPGGFLAALQRDTRRKYHTRR